MTNSELLEKEIEASGLKKGFIARELGLSRFSLIKKISNETEWKASEIDKMCEILKITSLTKRMQIFFARA